MPRSVDWPMPKSWVGERIGSDEGVDWDLKGAVGRHGGFSGVASRFLFPPPHAFTMVVPKVALVAHEGQTTRCADTMGNATSFLSFAARFVARSSPLGDDPMLPYRCMPGEGHSRIRGSFGSCRHSTPASLASHPFPKCGLCRSDRDSRCLPTLSSSGVPIAPSRPPIYRSLLGRFS
jgi:hypothetical protein